MKTSHEIILEAMQMAYDNLPPCKECKNSGFVDIGNNDDLIAYLYDHFNGDKGIFRKALKIYHDWKKYGTVECLECL